VVGGIGFSQGMSKLGCLGVVSGVVVNVISVVELDVISGVIVGVASCVVGGEGVVLVALCDGESVGIVRGTRGLVSSSNSLWSIFQNLGEYVGSNSSPWLPGVWLSKSIEI